MWPNPLFATDLVTFSEEILNRKLQFCAVNYIKSWLKEVKMSDSITANTMSLILTSESNSDLASNTVKDILEIKEPSGDIL